MKKGNETVLVAHTCVRGDDERERKGGEDKQTTTEQQISNKEADCLVFYRLVAKEQTAPRQIHTHTTHTHQLPSHVCGGHFLVAVPHPCHRL